MSFTIISFFAANIIEHFYELTGKIDVTLTFITLMMDKVLKGIISLSFLSPTACTCSSMRHRFQVEKVIFLSECHKYSEGLLTLKFSTFCWNASLPNFEFQNLQMTRNSVEVCVSSVFDLTPILQCIS